MYCSYKTLFEGLYRIDDDGNYMDNHNPYKSTGRYQTIPTVYALMDDLAKLIPVQIKQSTIASRWPTIAAKQEKFNTLYPESYYANCYVANNDNTWITYYNSKVNEGDKGTLFNLKYNTCKTLDIKHQLYGSAIINEYTDYIDVYMNNYDEDASNTLKKEVITISGASVKPTFSYKDRDVNQTESIITESWNNGEYTLTIQHNVPVDITINCSGNKTGHLTSFKQAVQTAPAFPDFYTGSRQYEGENFDMKNVEGNVTNGCNRGITGFQYMRFVKFGTNKAGTFTWTLRYSTISDINCVDLYVNGAKIKTLYESFEEDAVIFGDREITATSVPQSLVGAEAVRTACNSKMYASDLGMFMAGDDITVYVAVDTRVVPILPEWLKNWEKTEGNIAATSDLTFDLYKKNYNSGETVTLGMNGGNGNNTNYLVFAKKRGIILNGTLIKNLQVFDSENGNDWSIYNNTGTSSVIFGDRKLSVTSFPDNLVGAETIRTDCDSKLITTDLGTFTAGADITVYVAMDSRVTNPLPNWLRNWKKSGVTISMSNDLTQILFKKDIKAGEELTLCTNGGSNESVNYIVMAVELETVIPGDVNTDGTINAFDLAFAKQGYMHGFTNTLSYEAADINKNGIVETTDLKQIQDFLAARIKSFTKSNV